MAEVAIAKCPFCELPLISVGKHVPCCKGRDYQQYLDSIKKEVSAMS